jgi:hypothetical protein
VDVAAPRAGRDADTCGGLGDGEQRIGGAHRCAATALAAMSTAIVAKYDSVTQPIHTANLRDLRAVRFIGVSFRVKPERFRSGSAG